jgi:hypothetical protein
MIPQLEPVQNVVRQFTRNALPPVIPNRQARSVRNDELSGATTTFMNSA